MRRLAVSRAFALLMFTAAAAACGAGGGPDVPMELDVYFRDAPLDLSVRPDMDARDAPDAASPTDALDAPRDTPDATRDAPDAVDAPACPDGGTLCGVFCVDTASSITNCGACGNACTTARPRAVAACVASTCTTRCMPGFADCDGVDGNGCETELAADATHCGTCRASCAAATQARAACTMSTCVPVCNTPYANCDGDWANGCEIDTNVNVFNCGRCGNVCPPAPNARATCTAGTCTIACDPGWGNCDGDTANGCETNILSLPGTCGSCGNRCGVGQVCTLGMCQATCAAGLINCGGGCVSLASDPNNCGMCGTACPARAGAITTCTASVCGFRCGVGLADCDSNEANGCETPTSGDPNNCGACRNVCPGGTNATPACRSGVCGLACTAGYSDCDRAPGNGCEINTQTNAENCGTCGTVCPTAAGATRACVAGSCRIVCNAGFADCDSNTANGCETDLSTAANCGACGRACTGGTTCMSGTCR